MPTALQMRPVFITRLLYIDDSSSLQIKASTKYKSILYPIVNLNILTPKHKYSAAIIHFLSIILFSPDVPFYTFLDQNALKKNFGISSVFSFLDPYSAGFDFRRQNLVVSLQMSDFDV